MATFSFEDALKQLQSGKPLTGLTYFKFHFPRCSLSLRKCTKIKVGIFRLDSCQWYGVRCVGRVNGSLHFLQQMNFLKHLSVMVN
jgi:hypothetical protein